MVKQGSIQLNLLFNKLAKMTEKGLVIAFSGGVDSALLLAAACHAKKNADPPVRAVFLDSYLYPEQDHNEAKRLAESFGALFTRISFTEKDLKAIRNNPIDRCYRCKYQLFDRLLTACRSWGYTYLADGSNLDDDPAKRPGMQALAELEVRSPLLELNFDKEMVRSLATELRLPVSQKPSSPCLATRLPYGSHLDPRVLKKIAEGEGRLRQLGLGQLRLRLHNDVVRLEVEPDDFSLVLANGDEIIKELKGLGFTYITLDLEGFRSGSMDLLNCD